MIVLSFFKWTSIIIGIHFFMFKILTTKELVGDLQYNYHHANLLFIITSFVTISVLYLLSKKNNQYIGFVYLFLLTIKTVICYGMYEEFLSTPANFYQLEKMNILVLFFIFMVIELFQTTKVLNKVVYKAEA